jgi:hypothetical protein
LNIYKDLYDEFNENFSWIDLDTIISYDISYINEIDIRDDCEMIDEMIVIYEIRCHHIMIMMTKRLTLTLYLNYASS